MQHFLLLYASPKQTRPLQLVEEFRLIQDNLERIDADIKLVNIGKVRKHDLNEKFSHYRPVLVHFSGHGSGDGEIVLEDENGKAIIVEQALLETVFRLHREAIKCVVLACWYAEKQARAISKHIPFVVGMHGPVKDESSAVFSATFIKGLAYGLTIQEAFDHACTQMGMVDIEIKSIPRLYVRRDADAGSLRVIEQPRILARFILDKNNKPVIDHAYDEDNMFQMEIFIRHAPASISVVLFQYIDTKWSLEQQVAEVGHDCREFKDTLEENGDIEIRATLWNPQGGMAIKSSLL